MVCEDTLSGLERKNEDIHVMKPNFERRASAVLEPNKAGTLEPRNRVKRMS